MKWIPGRDCVVTPHNPNNSRTETRRAPSIFLFHICLRKLAAIRCTPNWLELQCHIGRVVSDAPRAVHLTSYQTINGFTPPSFPHSFRSSPPVSFDVSFYGFLLLFCPASLLNSPYQVPLELTVVKTQLSKKYGKSLIAEAEKNEGGCVLVHWFCSSHSLYVFYTVVAVPCWMFLVAT